LAHAPLSQTWPAPHAMPQPPQFALSVLMLAQYGAPPSPPQNVCPLAHVLPQLPLLQTSPAPHLVPHVPQFCASSSVSVQTEPHSFVPPPQLVAHLPCEQTCPLEHAVPHAPQFALSFCVSTQEPPQSVLLATHEVASPPASVFGLSSPPAHAPNIDTANKAAAHVAPSFHVFPMLPHYRAHFAGAILLITPQRTGARRASDRDRPPR